MSNSLTNHGGELLLVDSRRKQSLMIQNIIMLEGNVNYTIFHMKYGKKILYSHTLQIYLDNPHTNAMCGSTVFFCHISCEKWYN